MCRWYCTSSGPNTDLACLHCGVHYCGACLHGEKGKMPLLTKCAGCGLKPRTLANGQRKSWRGDPVPIAGNHKARRPSYENAYEKMLERRGSNSSSSQGPGCLSASTTLEEMRASAGFNDRPGSRRGSAARLSMERRPSTSSYQGGDRGGSGSAVVPVRSSGFGGHSRRGSGGGSCGGGGGGNGEGRRGSIFDRLTDPTSYGGTHKHRFDTDGNGRGLAGRDSISKGKGYTNGSHFNQSISLYRRGSTEAKRY